MIPETNDARRSRSLPAAAEHVDRPAAWLPPHVAWFEIAILLVPVIWLEWLFPSFPAITQLQPHPYWFPVLLLSLQYGTVSGLAAAAIAILGTLLIGLPEPDIGENHFYYLVRAWTQPALWIMAALVLGQFRLRQISAKAELERRAATLGRQSTTLFNHAEALRARCDRLERRLITRATSDGDRVLDRLSQLSRADAVSLAPAFAEAAAATFPGATLALYGARGDAFMRIARIGETDPARGGSNELATIAPGTAAWTALVEEARALCILDAGDEAALAGLGIAAVPVWQRGTGILIGILAAEMLPPAALGVRTLGRLAVLASHAGDALAGDSDQAMAASTGAPADLPGLLPRLRRWRHSIRALGIARGATAKNADTAKSPAPVR